MKKERKIYMAASVLVTLSLLSGCGKISSLKVDLTDSGTAQETADETTGSNQTTSTTHEKNETTVNEAEGTTDTSVTSAVSSDTQNTVNGSQAAAQPDATQANAQQGQNNTADTDAEGTNWWEDAEPEATYINGILIANKTYELPQTYDPGCLTEDTQKAFEIMQKDAAAQGLKLYIASGYRSYDLQKKIYNDYVNRDGQAEADTYSARPGHSEHQTGLAFDLNSIDDSFADTAEGKWVAQNCYKYGFIIRYPKSKESVTGYKYEPWHLRYLGTDTAAAVYNSGQCLEEYLGITSKYSD